MDELTRASREEEKKKSLEIYPSDKRNISLSSSHPCRSTSKARVITETIRSLQFLFLSAFLRVFPSILWWRKVRFLYLSQQRFVKSLNSISRVANSSYIRYTKVGLAYLLILKSTSLCLSLRLFTLRRSIGSRLGSRLHCRRFPRTCASCHASNSFVEQSFDKLDRDRNILYIYTCNWNLFIFGLYFNR